MKKSGKNVAGKVIDQIVGLFLPLINVITGVSILKSIVVLLATVGVIAETDGIYVLFYAASDGFFYFLPFFLAYTAAKQWHTDPVITMLIPCAMLYPDLVDILENGQTLTFAGINVASAVYHSSVLPVIMAVGLLHFVEKPCDKIPETVRGFLKPIICCLIVIPITFLVFGPLGTVIGDFLTGIFFKIYEANPTLAGAFLGFLIQPMVSIGAHWSIVPVCLNNILTRGYDIMLPLMGGAVMGQAGAALGVGIIRRADAEQKRVAYQASLAAVLGVTEPALFGVNLAVPRAMLSACIGGAVGGAMAGWAGTRCYTFAFPSYLTCVAYYGQGFVTFLLSMAVGFVIGLLLTLVQAKWIRKTALK